MNMSITGEVFVYGDNIDTDQIYPGRYLDVTDFMAVGKHAMEGCDPEFVGKVHPGDIIVAGSNFGCGSSREHAVITLQSAGVGAILAESFARIFYRNAFNLGIPLIIVKDITKFAKTGDQLTVDVRTGIIMNCATGDKIQGEPISEYMLKILESGGIKNLILSRDG